MRSHFQIALNYGSRDEITRAVNKMLEDQKEGKAAGTGDGGNDF